MKTPWQSDSPSSSQDDRAWKLIERLTQSSLKEQRRARRWGIFFKSLTFVWLFVVSASFYIAMNVDDISSAEGSEQHTALVDIDGEIGGNDVTADDVVTGLRAAFEAPNSKAVILRINSPGGSPVQSGYIYDEMRRLQTLHPDKPLYAVITDIGASGGYYIAAAAGNIYADKASIVGSIGVISSGFGFLGAMEKLGITRRTYTAGSNKAFLDPFMPVNKDAAAMWQESLDTIHQQFINAVKASRGDRLKDQPELYSGMIWSGERALELGLIDGLGSTGYVAREVIKDEGIVNYTVQESLFESFAKNLGTSMGSVAIKALNSSMQLQ